MPTPIKLSRSHISIHAPTRGATFREKCLTNSALFQSTLPREERHDGTHEVKVFYCISIHAPTRGATSKQDNSRQTKQFQSTLPREERRIESEVLTMTQSISIHAPTRGATAFVNRIVCGMRNFNPRSHERSDASSPALY